MRAREMVRDKKLATNVVTCAHCGERVTDDGLTRFQAATRIKNDGAYANSKGLDAQVPTAICNRCLHQLIASFASALSKSSNADGQAPPASDQKSQVLDPEAIFQSIERLRVSGELAKGVASSRFRYQASTGHTGLLEQVDSEDGSVTVGTFHDGSFHAIDGSKEEVIRYVFHRD